MSAALFTPPLDPLTALRSIAPAIEAGAAALDQDGAFPAAEVELLHAAGLLAAPLPRRDGGAGLGTDATAATMSAVALRLIGRASLPLGRLYEGHVNALRLVLRRGTPAQAQAAARDARAGRLFAVWNTEAPGEVPLCLRPAPGGWRLDGRKVLCSGAGRVERALVTARDPQAPDAPPRLVLVALSPGARADLTPWTAQGMRASATGAMDFSGLAVSDAELIGVPGDYERQPDFSAGAWRFAAVHLGGAEALAEALRAHLRRTARGGDPHQAARLGQVGIALETARLWVEGAAPRAEAAVEGTPAAAAVAYVNLARLAVERAALDVLELVQRSVGLSAFLRPNPAERIARDLATYLRQPGPDRALAAAAAHLLQDPAPLGELWG